MPIFLTVEQVKRIHQTVLEAYGGLDGLRDAGLLSSAVAMPEATFDGKWLHADVFEMTAAYLFHIVKNHPFIDGNKRVGAACALVFFEINGMQVSADEDGVVEITVRTATGRAEKRDIAEFFRSIS